MLNVVPWNPNEEKASKKRGEPINAADTSSKMRPEKWVLDLVTWKSLRAFLRKNLGREAVVLAHEMNSTENDRKETETKAELRHLHLGWRGSREKCLSQRVFKKEYIIFFWNGINNNMEKIQWRENRMKTESHECHRGLFQYCTCLKGKKVLEWKNKI